MYSVVKQTNYARRPGWSLLAALAGLLLFPAGEAGAVWAHRHFCEDEREAVNGKKNALDKCVDKVESELESAEPQGKEIVKEQVVRTSPCESELAAMIEAGKNLNRCVEKQLWWMPAKKLK